MGFCFKCLFALLVDGSDYGCAQLDPLRRNTSLALLVDAGPVTTSRRCCLDSPSISYRFCYT
ncbi:hypothetical protein GQ55_5G241000 [Panicum hallii var. hallii]|uniref:Secreted protein n=2 Tax=Panicum hallii TaxID=206008 RepID=A0A2T7DJQ7_9POAL|nr:hypothetical protein PAHAL_5G242800 [Panicum hallii]PUZ55802.1 hypothetical protein GQ55_5G241000 [Panicum hallii var. hallii]PUZ55803.1 hypothetical protein GQ55_5G241000 [Panicum hallii var. hallii]